MPEALLSREDDLFNLLYLHLATLYQPGLGLRLLEAFGGARQVLRQPAARLLAVSGMTRGVLRRLRSSLTERAVKAELREARQAGVRFLHWSQAEYPAQLRQLTGMPLLLYSKGDEASSEAALSGKTELPPLTVGMVGSRHPSLYGLKQARRFAGAFARRGIAIVSGLALGIDGEAHRAALDEGGRTVAVLGSGLGRVYPRENQDLARRMVEEGRGVLVSEFPMSAAPKSFHFPMRNRILSGVSTAVLVVEAGERSGSLITVNHALEQGKSVFVVPGRVDQPQCMGCLNLLRDGAAPAIEPDDVLPGAACPPGGNVPRPCEPASDVSGPPLPGPIGPSLDKLFAEEDSWHPDRLAERLGVSPSEILSEISRLEMEGALQRLPGGSYTKAGSWSSQ